MKKARGHPKTFKDGEELIKLWSDFCNQVVQDGFKTVPTQSSFCRWLQDHYQATDRKTIYNSLNKYFPAIKKEFERIQSDVIMQGGMLGHYQPTMSIFGLKNWCGWSDQGIKDSSEDEDAKQEDLLNAIRKAVNNEN